MRSRVSAQAGGGTQDWLTSCHLVPLQITTSDSLLPGSEARGEWWGHTEVAGGQESWGRTQYDRLRVVQ